MSLGQGTFVNDGQRFSGPTAGMFAPVTYGPQTTGVPQVSPTMPPFLGGSAAGATSSGGMANVGGYGTADNNGLVTATAANHPHNWKVSPVWWAVGALVIGLLALQGVHWRKTILQGDEGASVGRASESAHAEV